MPRLAEVLPEETLSVLRHLAEALEEEKKWRKEEKRAVGILLRNRRFREVVCRFTDPGPRFAVGKKVLREAGVRLPKKLASRAVRRAEGIILKEGRNGV
ncbi:hypothetical protein Adeg_0713 [Ammonifex degensii KC4]|uniref:Uncharacterized protein n=1 Tax=Ammonifex degensii (strain DSM 10501 / KC4) TaxID=429009 RepID=C9RC83_AMMDK|nr:hypothetical protein [Ammonifex degensii]ACX51860.1 hypothetical protein Adeg_0713 [Ammonifex degensii KC4]